MGSNPFATLNRIYALLPQIRYLVTKTINRYEYTATSFQNRRSRHWSHLANTVETALNLARLIRANLGTRVAGDYPHTS
jgi:hypothetical protein